MNEAQTIPRGKCVSYSVRGRTALKEGLGEDPSHCRRAHLGLGWEGRVEEDRKKVQSSPQHIFRSFFSSLMKYLNLPVLSKRCSMQKSHDVFNLRTLGVLRQMFYLGKQVSTTESSAKMADV